MKPCKILVRLANDDVIWVTGRGNVVFLPLIDGKPAEAVEFSRVLYVPDLESNLFSVLSAVHRSKLKVVICIGFMLCLRGTCICICLNKAPLRKNSITKERVLFSKQFRLKTLFYTADTCS